MMEIMGALGVQVFELVHFRPLRLGGQGKLCWCTESRISWPICAI
jgi:hypothetical protein